MSLKYPITLSQATIAETIGDKGHRYSLARAWAFNNLFSNSSQMIMFVGLNPSRADDIHNDATIRRCIRFAQEWSYAGMYFANLYSFRTPYVKGPLLPKDIAEGWKPLIENLDNAYNDLTDQHLRQMIKNSMNVVCCWGSWTFTKEREKQVLAMIDNPLCFGRNSDGSPKHPLYLPNNAKTEKYWK